MERKLKRNLKPWCQGLLLLLLFAPASSRTPAFQVLTYPFSSRAAGMGGTSVAYTGKYLEMGTNPAALVYQSGFQGQASTVQHLAGIRGYGTSLSLPLGVHRFGGEVRYFNYGLFTHSDEFGQTSSTFGFHEIAAQAAYAYSISPRIHLGTRMGFVQRVADGQNHSQGVLDLGFIFNRQEDSLSIGVVAENLPLGPETEILPTRVRLGSSKVLTYLPLRLNLEAEYEQGGTWTLALGGEILIHPAFALRLGLDSNRFDLQTAVSKQDFLAGFSGGFVVQHRGILLEMAVHSLGAAGTVSQLGIGAVL